jgi:hypothetical protein
VGARESALSADAEKLARRSLARIPSKPGAASSEPVAAAVVVAVVEIGWVLRPCAVVGEATVDDDDEEGIDDEEEGSDTAGRAGTRMIREKVRATGRGAAAIARTTSS